MANLIEIVLAGKDQTSAAFTSAAKNATAFASSSKTLAGEMRAGQIAFQSVASAANSFGGPSGALAGVASTVALSIGQMQQLRVAATSTATAIAASFGPLLAAAAAGWASASAVVDVQMGKTLAAVQARIAADKISTEALRETLTLTHSYAAAESLAINAINARIAAVNKLNISEEQRASTLKILENLLTTKLEAQGDGQRQKVNDLLAQFIQLTYTAKGSEQAAFEAAAIGHEARLRQIEDLAVTTQQAQTLSGAEHELYEAEKTRITQEQAAARQAVEDAATAAYTQTLLQRVNREREMERFQKQTRATNFQQTSAHLGMLADAAAVFGKKSLVAYKVFATSQAIIDTWKAAESSYAWGSTWGGPAAGAAMAAIAVAAGMANVAKIQAVGQAHAGMDNVPSDGSYILKQGEMVHDPGTARGMRMLARDYEAGGGGGGQGIRVIVNLDRRPILDTVASATRSGELIIDAAAVQ